VIVAVDVAGVRRARPESLACGLAGERQQSASVFEGTDLNGWL
jgi:hypothetical protein